MSDEIKNAVRQHLEPLLATQTAHPVEPRVEVLWEESHTIEACTVRVGGMISTMPPSKVLSLLKQRRQNIEKGGDGDVIGTDPVRHLYAPPEYRDIIKECVRKRLENPGVQLWLWLNGGIRSSKTEFCMWVMMCHFWWTQRAWCWAFHETERTSRSNQQERAFRFIPQELRKAKYKRNEGTLNYTPGNGFTGSQLYLTWDAHNEGGCLMPGKCDHATPCVNRMNDCGGRTEFNFYGQDETTMVGQELTMALTDERVPPNLWKLIDDRLLTRAADTRRPEFQARMLDAMHRLERGEWLPPPLLGAVFHGWLLNGYTPKFGWAGMVKVLLGKARKYGWIDPRPMVQQAMQQAIDAMATPERRQQKADELTRKPWTLGTITRVPRFAQPQNERALVAYLPTYVNRFKGNWPGAVESVQGRPDEEIGTTLFGDVKKDVTSLFMIDPERHYRKEHELPMAATIGIVADPAPAKPWAIKWVAVDALGRHRVLQEWPCEKWEIPDYGLPGPWAVPSESDRMNGDPGPAQKLRMGWSCDWDKMHWLIYLGNIRLAKRLRAVHGDKCQITLKTMHLQWQGLAPGSISRSDLELKAEMVMPSVWLMDSRFAAAPSATKGNQPTTIIEQMLECENAPPWQVATGRATDEGYSLLGNAFGTDVAGIPKLTCQDECTNTQFAWEVWTPNGPKDEACKDMLDPDRYWIEQDVEFEGNIQLTSGGRR